MNSIQIFSRFLLIAIFSCTGFVKSAGQITEPVNYPQQYFAWPLKIKVGLVANFGELRPNHYHMGLDMRTDQKVNVPVYASADGYIAKVKIEPFGFGRCIYINHPNGYTTLYAHLNDFYPALEKYITEQQYNLQQWKVFLDIPPSLFPVKKGDFIAYSGNTGGSQGPHVHFEIRDTKTDKVLNPLLFGMPVPDNVPPGIVRLAVYDRTKSTYEQTPKIYPLKKVNGVYMPVGGVIKVNTSKVSFAIGAYDCFSGSSNQNGIYSAVIYDNNQALCGFEMNNISYDETRYLNAHIDYKTRSSGGPFLQHLSILPGYNNGIYKMVNGNDGILSLWGAGEHSVKIVVKDANQNASTINFSLVKTGGASIADTNGEQIFLPNAVNIFENNNVRFYMPETAVYDAFTFMYKESNVAGTTVYQLHNNTVPVQNYFPISIRGSFPLEDTGHIVMERFYGTKNDFKKAVYENGWYKASFREFGNYRLINDKTAPVITPIGFYNGIKAHKLSRIAFMVTDNTEEILRFTALLDGKWLRFSNDKGKVFQYVFDERCPPGEHELKIIAEDLAGNKTERVYRFVR